MKTIIREVPRNKQVVLPKIGEVWRHGKENGLRYLRISDHDGRKALKHNVNKNAFYSVCLNSGSLVFTSINDGDMSIQVCSKAIFEFEG